MARRSSCSAFSASISTVVRPLHIDAMTTPDGSFVLFMVLEWLEGETLDEIIRRRTQAGEGPLPPERLVELLSPVARALDRAHHFSGPQGPVSIVHRDLKPENIFVARVAGEEVVKILDFGIGKVKSVANQVAGRASQEAEWARLVHPCVWISGAMGAAQARSDGAVDGRLGARVVRRRGDGRATRDRGRSPGHHGDRARRSAAPHAAK